MGSTRKSPKNPVLLGIETSCDECSASVVRYGLDRLEVLGLSTFSQINLHARFGGVVPEVASRNHLESINDQIALAMNSAGVRFHELDAVAVTQRPGLVGALLVGVSAAKALSYAIDRPLVPVHHLEGHIVSPFLGEVDRTLAELPMLVVLVSGGHSQFHLLKVHPELWPKDFLTRSLLGRSRDDAAGEAYDKTAKLLGFPYPGGKYLDEMSEGGDPRRYEFPRALPQKATLDLSFSGLKTAVHLKIQELKKNLTPQAYEEELPHLCASIQEAINDALLRKIQIAVESHQVRSLAVVGGVAANRDLRRKIEQVIEEYGLQTPAWVPELRYCTDNAAMIAAAGCFRYLQGDFVEGNERLKLNAFASSF
jgi:N6-L-threonylcarbamoyladenine synthase